MSVWAGVSRWGRIRVAGAWLAVVGLTVAGLGNLLLPAATGPDNPAIAYILFAAIVAAYGGVGALIVTRQSGNAVGWILWLTGILIGLDTASSGYAVWSSSAFGGALPGSVFAARLTQWGFSPPLVIALLFLPLLFPDGHLPSRRWRPALVFAIATVILASLPDMLTPGPLGPIGAPNPTGWTGDPAVLDVLRTFSQVSPLLALPIAVAAAVARFRRGSAIEREQLKWFGATAAFALIALSIAVLTTDAVALIAWMTALVGVGLMPVAIGIAILRYRLYAIDRIISRTIGWALTTGLIVAVFAGIVIGLQGPLAEVTGGNSLAVAGSTLWRCDVPPLRRRVQSAVDRRFNRARYDAERTVAAFAHGLGAETSLEEVQQKVVVVVRLHSGQESPASGSAEASGDSRFDVCLAAADRRCRYRRHRQQRPAPDR